MIMAKKSDTRPPRRLSADEKRLWKKITQHTRRMPSAPPVEFDFDDEDDAPEAAKPERQVIRKYKPAAARMQTPPKPAPKELVAGDLRDMDANTAARIKRGRYAIDRTLDLHGMS